MSGWYYIVVIFFCLLLWIALVFVEFRRANKARLVLRLIANTLLVAALLAIALPVTYRTSIPARSKEKVLLTEGYDPDSARFYLSTREEIKDPKSICCLSALHILGYGLTKEERDSAPDVPMFFHPSALQSGVGSLSWTRQLLPGEVFRIQGSFYNTTGAPVKLLLFGMNTLLDSAGISSRQGDFELRTVPVQSDRAVYTLMAVAGKDTVEREQIPVEVLQKKNLSILMLAASPDFENRFLAGWLSDKGHAVAVRTAISRDKYDHVYLNTAALAVDHLSPTLLDKFDIVIADAAELKAMGAAAHDYLWRAVAEKGLGLVIRADSSSMRGHADKIIQIGGGQISESMHGSGKIILTNLHTTYAGLLAGEKRAYASLWTRILQEAARGQAGREQWHISPGLAAVDQPAVVRLQSSALLPQGLMEGDSTRGAPVSVYMAEDSLLSFCWQGVYWPREAGWQTAHTSKEAGGWWYVWKKGDWKNIHRMERMEGTRQWVEQRNKLPQGPSSPGESEAHSISIAKGWFCLIFVLCAVFLWVERKI